MRFLRNVVIMVVLVAVAWAIAWWAVSIFLLL